MGKKKAAAPKPGLALDEGERALNRAAVKRLGTSFTVETPDFGDVAFYALQPEQITTVRARLLAAGWKSAAAIKLPAESDAKFADRRQLLAHLQRICARDPETCFLRFPGAKGIERLLQLDDNRLVNMARQIVEFNHIFDKPPADPDS